MIYVLIVATYVTGSAGWYTTRVIYPDYATCEAIAGVINDVKKNGDRIQRARCITEMGTGQPIEEKAQ